MNVSDEPVACISRENVRGVTFQRTVIFAIHTHASVVDLCFLYFHIITQSATNALFACNDDMKLGVSPYGRKRG
jgi:hypothetical protein